jgi:uncharacterized OB-fold protein
MAEAPVVAPDEVFFWDGVAEGKLLIQRCADCGALRHPPAPMCGDCGSLAWDTQPSSGRGRVYSWIESHHPNRPDEAPRIVILVELDEGVRLVSNLVDAPHAGPYEDLDVEVVFRPRDDGVTMPYFRVVGTGTDAA